METETEQAQINDIIIVFIFCFVFCQLLFTTFSRCASKNSTMTHIAKALLLFQIKSMLSPLSALYHAAQFADALKVIIEFFIIQYVIQIVGGVTTQRGA